MLKTSIKVAYRKFLNHKVFTLLEITGLSIGIICCLLIFQYTAYERNYDTFNKNAENIFRIRLDEYKEGKLQWQSAVSYPPVGPAMKKDFPEVKSFCRLYKAPELLSYAVRNLNFKETQGYYADESTLHILNIDLVKSNSADLLDGPKKIVLSKSMAKKYFGGEDPIGKFLIAKKKSLFTSHTEPLQVTGIFNDYPENSHLVINYLISYQTLTEEYRQNGYTTNPTETSWKWSDFYTYLELQPGTDYKKLESKFPAFCDRYINLDGYHQTTKLRDDMFLQPLRDIHLASNYNEEAEINGDGKAVTYLFLIGIFVIGIAWINYINLTTARSIERAKEVGVRKVAGALRSNLIRQFLIESLLFNSIALLVAAGLIYLIGPAFNQIIGANIPGIFLLSSNYMLLFLLLFLGGSFISGVYPAFILSAYQPIKVLKGAFKNTARGSSLRKGLIIFQFTASIVLIAGTIIVFQQISFMRNQKLGANINQTLVVEGANSIVDSANYQNGFTSFKNDIFKIHNVNNITSSTDVMGNEIIWTRFVKKLNDNSLSGNTLFNLGVDYDFVPAYGIELKAGRNFSKDFPSDSKAVLLNESAVKTLGFKNPSDAVSQKVIYQNLDTLKVVGVIADFHQQGMKKNVDPMLLLLRPETRAYYSIKLGTKNVQYAIAAIKAIWANHFPDDPFNYFFLNDYFDKQYRQDVVFGKLFGFFASIAILIACFGLLGLSAYTVFQRAKEISIRKVLGASAQSLLYLISKDFLNLVALSFLVAVPVCWYIMHRWLENYANRISISLPVFIFTGLTALTIALATISFYALKAAFSDPIKNLRNE